MEENSLEELNKLEEQIIQTQNLLNKTKSNDGTVAKFKRQRNIFILTTILLLAGLLFSYFYFNKGFLNTKTNNENALIIDKDSLTIYKDGYYKSLELAYPVAQDNKPSIKDEKVIYSVQIGAFKDFTFTSESLSNLAEFQSNGYNKFNIGNYKTYAEAKVLKDSLQKLGFRDCFLSAISFGQPINIREALLLSDEPQFLEQ